MPPLLNQHCAKCGYDLTGLPWVGSCPECGQPYNATQGQGIAPPGAHNVRRRWRSCAIALAGISAIFLATMVVLWKLLHPCCSSLVIVFCLILLAIAGWIIPGKKSE